jgi:hypothetical protein
LVPAGARRVLLLLLLLLLLLRCCQLYLLVLVLSLLNRSPSHSSHSAVHSIVLVVRVRPQ